MNGAQLLIAQLRYQAQRHGWPAVLGLALVVAAVGFQLSLVAAMHARGAALQAEQTALRQKIAQGRGRPEAGRADDTAALLAALPAAGASAAAIDVIHGAAHAAGVRVAQGEYRVSRDSGGPLLRYQITLPAQARYPQLRAWLAEVMNALPTAALDEISLKREEVGAETLEARLRLTLFLRAH